MQGSEVQCAGYRVGPRRFAEGLVSGRSPVGSRYFCACIMTPSYILHDGESLLGSVNGPEK